MLQLMHAYKAVGDAKQEVGGGGCAGLLLHGG